jgi:hypothetical protein
LPHDLGVAAEIGEVHTRLDSELREREIEVVGDRAAHRITLREECAHGGGVTHIDRHLLQAIAKERLQEGGERADFDVGEQYALDLRAVQQIERARGALQPRAEYEHTHLGTPDLRMGE